MYLKEIHLTNFRNYASLGLHPSTAMNILVGPNAQGKSNFLEAIYVLTTTKSHRTSRDMDLIKVDAEAAGILADVIREKQGDVILQILLSRAEKKTVKINTVRHAKIADIVGQLNSVIFSSEDLAMIKGEPSERRRFLNLEVSQVSGQYIYSFASYKRALMQRNALLKTIKNQRGSAGTLSTWDEQLIAFGSVMIKKRSDFVRHLASLAAPIHAQLTEEAEVLKIKYEPNIPVSGDETVEEISVAFRKALNQCRQHELARGTSLKGPHRDDISFRLDDLDVRYFGSQGQQRTAALSVKLAEIQLVEELVGEPPVVLLDDVMAELDETRRGHVFDLTFGRCQTFATATSLDEFPQEVVAGSAVFTVRKGQVTKL